MIVGIVTGIITLILGFVLPMRWVVIFVFCAAALLAVLFVDRLHTGTWL
jgi:hypothetical protein